MYIHVQVLHGARRALYGAGGGIQDFNISGIKNQEGREKNLTDCVEKKKKDFFFDFFFLLTG